MDKMESKILEYKESLDESLFEDIINDSEVKKYINYTCYQKLRNSPTTLYSQEDFVNLAYLVIWQAIHKYRFICPCCKKQAKTHAAYKLHTLAKHDQYFNPYVSIIRFIKFRLGAYLQNAIRKEYSLERKSNVMTINIYSPQDDSVHFGDTDTTKSDRSEYDIAMELSIENEIVFQQSIEPLIKQFDELTKEIFNYMFIDRLKQREVANILYNEGKYSSEQSAAVVVSRIIKNKINPAIMKLYPELI